MKTKLIKGEKEVMLIEIGRTDNYLVYNGYFIHGETPSQVAEKSRRIDRGDVRGFTEVGEFVEGLHNILSAKSKYAATFKQRLLDNGVSFENPYEINMMDGTFEAAERNTFKPERTLVFVKD